MKPIQTTVYIIDDSHIDAHSLRADLYDYFSTLSYMLSDTEYDHIAKHAEEWIQNHLIDHDTFHRSVSEKAYEVGSGDHLLDYYVALQMRRDQLLAARDVFGEYVNLLKGIFSEMRHDVEARLAQFDFEQGIYLRALDYYFARMSASNPDMIVFEKVDEVAPKKKRATSKKAETADKKQVPMKKKATKSRVFYKSL